MRGKLVASGWLRRVIELETDSRPVRVEYNGRGMGYESVLVGGEVADTRPSGAWFVPRFDFQVRGKPAKIEVRCWPWFCLRRLEFKVGGETVYAEPTNWWELGAALLFLLLCAAGIRLATAPSSGAEDSLPPVESASR